ncbi:MAG: hypothetical protein ACLTTH_07755 [Holdemanella porci]
MKIRSIISLHNFRVMTSLVFKMLNTVTRSVMTIFDVIVFFSKKGWKVSMKLYKTIPVFLTIILVGTLCSIISAALEEDEPPFDANDTVLVTETNTYVDYIPSSMLSRMEI